MTLLGLRVIAGGSSDYSNNDIILGTLTDDKYAEQHFVTVLWDNRNENTTYGIGSSKGYQLVIYDSGPAGVKHEGYTCKGCNTEPIYGTKWCCLDCDVFACTECYMKDFHEKHYFYRLDSPDEIGSFVGKRKNSDIITGIFKNSVVETRSELSPTEIGVVDSFCDNEGSYRSFVKVLIISKQKLKKKKLGYHGEVDIRLKNNPKDAPTKRVYKNHLRIVNLHPIFNTDFYKSYEAELKQFNFQETTEDTNFELDDAVYIDCFDNISLKRYQNIPSGYNVTVEKLIGKKGLVKVINRDNVQVYFEKINQQFCFNKAILFNARNCGMKVIKITEDEAKLRKEIENWKNSQVLEKARNKNWIPDDTILQKIIGKFGVCFVTLPGKLIGIRFKRHPHCFCMILPDSVCQSIEEKEETDENVLCANWSLKDNFDNTDLETGKVYIENNDLTEFLTWRSDKIISSNDWSKLLQLAIKYESLEIVEKLLKEIERDKQKNCLVLKIVLLKYSKNLSITPNILKILIQYIFLPEEPVDNEGNNLLHISSKHNDLETVELLLNKHKKLLDVANEITGFTALHYAVINNHVAIIEVLMKHGCDLYKTDKDDKSTPLHLSLRHHAIESFCRILELLQEELDISIVDKKKENILHLAASYPSDDDFTHWQRVIENSSIISIEEIRQKSRDFKLKSKSKYLENFDMDEMPFAVFTYLIFTKNKSARHSWITESDNCKVPEEIFNQSLKKLKKPVHINAFKLFMSTFNKERSSEFCQFCHLDFATVTYKPCDHKIHCGYCAFMPYKCSQCDKDIEEKCPESQSLSFNSFDDWDKLKTKVKGDVQLCNMKDWYQFVEATIKSLECPICVARNWNIVLKCRHQLCEQCFNEYKMCTICKTENPEYFKLRD